MFFPILTLKIIQTDHGIGVKYCIALRSPECVHSVKMVDYHTPGGGTMEIIPPEGHIDYSARGVHYPARGTL